MPASAAIPGLFLTFAAMVLLIFVSVSAPTWNSIYFLSVGPGRDSLHYGVFGFTGSSTQIGYHFLGNNVNSTTLFNLTKTLILHPIAAGLAGLAFLFGLCGASYHRAGTVFMSILSGLALLITLLAWIIDMALFGIARHRYREAGMQAQYGNANWITLGALVALLLGVCVSFCGAFGRYRRPRGEVY